MTIYKSLLCIGVLSLSTLSIASAKSYGLLLSAPTKAGTVQLMPGSYKLKVEGSNAIFTEQQTLHSFTVPVKIQNGTKKYSSTQIDTAKQGDMDQIQTIELEGSTTQLAFGR
jgi:hypothetical protein